MTETQALKGKWVLPPGWEAVTSESKKVYYWNKKTGETTWTFPEQEAKEHVKMVRRHTYENIHRDHAPSCNRSPVLASKVSVPGLPKTPASCVLLQQPPRSRRATQGRGTATPTRAQKVGVVSPGVSAGPQISASSKKGYENVILPEVQSPVSSEVQYEEIHTPPAASRGRMSSLTSSNLSEPLSPSPPLPDRKYSDTDLLPPDLSDMPPSGPASELVGGACTSPEGAGGRKVSAGSEGGRRGSVNHTPAHQLSDTGMEYAVISRSCKQRSDVGVVAEETGTAPPTSTPPTSAPPTSDLPTLPLRAHQRMSNREDRVGDSAEEGGGANVGPEVVVASNPVYYTEVGAESGHTPSSAPLEGYRGAVAYSVIQMDPEADKMASAGGEGGEEEEEPPCPLSPRPYEVASPTPGPTSGPTPGPTPHHELNTDPHYEEIENKNDEEMTGDGYMKVSHHRMARPRGFSSPTTLDTAPRSLDSTLSPTSPKDDSIPSYDLPMNSRKLQALNVTLRRSTTPQSSEYAKLSLSKEAILLRSGVTLRRHVRESLSSLSSYASQMEGEGGEEGRKDSEGASSDEDALEPINKCIKSLESSLLSSNSPEAEEYLNNLIMPPPSSPSWVNFRRRPHAYEEIMGASQEELDWDESDLTGVPPTPSTAPQEEGNSETCEMVKIDKESTALREPRVRVVNHQYEDVVLGEGPAPQEGEGAGLPKGWQRMRDEQQREYFWHIPTGRTQYSPPHSSPMKKQSSVSESGASPRASGQSAAVHQFPARYLGWMPVSEDRLVTGQCVKVVHACISKMAGSLQDKEMRGEEVLLQVEGMELHWLEPATSSVITAQQINRIRVWGIGLEDERDFGYVSRDPATKKHRCHIFCCTTPARAVAHVLLDTHQQQRKARQKARLSRQQPLPPSQAPATSPSQGEVLRPPPTSNGAGPHEHYERFTCLFIGSCGVGHGQSMDALNGAVERLSLTPAQWQEVSVDVAISSVTITDLKSGRVLKEHRIRYLSFLGIATNDRFCGYILDCGNRNGEKCFRFYGFRMEPNTDRLCLSLHTACQARFQRVLEANARRQAVRQQPSQVAGRESLDSRSGSSVLGKLGSLKKSKKISVGEVKTFVVQYLGHQGVSRVDGLDTVRPVVQELAVSRPKAGYPQLVEFDIAPSGLSVKEGQGKTASRKDFPVKCITYVVKIRNYFAFVAKERSKYVCHAFMEYKIDAGTIVTTVQDTLVPQSAK